jgi:isocitrate/isopropylmalate dehydrogenase
MLDHIGDRFRADRIRRAVESIIRDGKVRTRDLGGSATTKEFTDAVVQHLA